MPRENKSLSEYKARIILAINYINDNLSEKITLDDISGAACFSPFHFHRIFTNMLGETPSDFLNRVRLEKAANLLILNSSLTISEIVVTCGFSSSAVFSRAFRKKFGVSASEWAKQNLSNEKSKNCKQLSKKRKTSGFAGSYFIDTLFEKNNLRRNTMNVEIKELPALHLAYFPQYDGYKEEKIGAAWEKLCNWGFSENLITKDTVWAGVSFDNPDITPNDKCRYYACISVSENVTPPKGFGIIDLPGGRHAVYRFKGKSSEIPSAYKKLYGEWLPNSGFEPCDSPCYEIYYETPDKNSEGMFVMDICFPVKSIK